MPTSSQAMFVMTGEGERPRVPRRNLAAAVQTNMPFIYPNDETAGCQAFHSGFIYSSGFPGVVNIGGSPRKLLYDTKTKMLRLPGMTRELIADEVDLESSRNKQQNTNTTENESEEQETRKSQLENPGFRKRRTAFGGPKKHKNRSDNTVSIPKDAKYMPTPPGATPLPLPPIVIPTANQGNHGDMPMIDNEQQRKRQKEKYKSFLEELKESVSYDSRILPSMEMKKSLPPPSLNTVVFSLRNNEDYTHKDIMDLIKNETGVKPISIQYDPVNVRVGSTDMTSRWIVKFECPADTRFVIKSGFEISGEKVIVRMLDSVLKMEFEAYKYKMEEERTREERESMTRFERKPRKKRSSVKHTLTAKL